MGILGGILREDAITTWQAAKILGMKQDSVARLIARGRLRSYGKMRGVRTRSYHILSEAEVRAYRPRVSKPDLLPDDARTFLDDPDAMTTAEAAELLGLTAQGIRERIRKGHLSARRVRLKRDGRPVYILSRREVECIAQVEPEGWLTVREAASILGLSESRVYQLALKAVLPAKRIKLPGHRARYQVWVKPELREPPSQVEARRAFYASVP
jgi:excisionase family DNA binding protein